MTRLAHSLATTSEQCALLVDGAGAIRHIAGDPGSALPIYGGAPTVSHIERLFDAEDACRYAQAWDRVCATTQCQSLHLRGARADTAWQVLFEPVVEQDRCVAYLVTVKDVSAQQQSDTAFALANDRYRLVADNSSDIIMRLGLDGRPHFVSEACRRITGLDPEALVGVQYRHFVHPGDWPGLEAALAEVHLGGTLAPQRFRQRTEKGNWRWMEAGMRLLCNDDGSPREVVATIRDVHSRRFHESVLAENAAKLREVHHCLLLAEDMAEVARWRWCRRGDAFDFGHGLHAMCGRTSGGELHWRALLRRLSGADRSTFIAALRRACERREGATCNLVVNGWDDHSREVEVAIHAAYDEKGRCDGWYGIVADRTRSAAQHEGNASEGDDAFRAARASARLLTALRERLSYGAPFADGAIDAALGDVASAVAGRDAAELDDTLGAVERLLSASAIASRTAGAASPSDGMAPAIARSRPCNGTTPCVLVAEDNPISRRLVVELLEALGCTVVATANGRDAVDAAQERRFDIVMLDLMLPELDGLSAARRIRSLGGLNSDAPLVALTADQSIDRRRFAHVAGFDHFLAKPVDADALESILASLGLDDPFELASRTAPSDPVAMAQESEAPEMRLAVGYGNGTTIPRGQKSSAASAPPSDAAALQSSPLPPPPPLLDHARLAQLTRLIGDERLEMLVSLLRRELQNRPALIDAAMAAADCDALGREAHHLKGAASSAGAPRIAGLASAIEQAANDGRIDRSGVAALGRASADTLAALRSADLRGAIERADDPTAR